MSSISVESLYHVFTGSEKIGNLRKRQCDRLFHQKFLLPSTLLSIRVRFSNSINLHKFWFMSLHNFSEDFTFCNGIFKLGSLEQFKRRGKDFLYFPKTGCKRLSDVHVSAQEDLKKRNWGKLAILLDLVLTIWSSCPDLKPVLGVAFRKVCYPISVHQTTNKVIFLGFPSASSLPKFNQPR